MILIYLFNEQFFLIFAGIPFGLFCIMRCIIYSMDQNALDCNSVSDFIIIGFRLFLLIQLITIGLKVDKMIKWTWKEVFWSYWVLFSILLGIDLGMFLMIWSKVCQILVGDTQQSGNHEIKGLLWFFLVTVIETIGSLFLVMGILQLKEENSKYQFKLLLFYEEIEELQICAYYLIISLFFNLVITVFLHKHVLNFLKSIAKAITESEQSQQLNQQHQNNASRSLDKSKEIEKTEPISIPKFLMKFSSTYFKRAGDIVPNKIKQINKQNNSKLLASVKTPQKKMPPISQSDRQHLRATSLYEIKKNWKENLRGSIRKKSFENERQKSSISEKLNLQKNENQNSSQRIAQLQKKLGLNSISSMNQNHARVQSMQTFHKNTNSYTMSARVPFQFGGAFSPINQTKESEKESAKSNLSIAQQCLICFGDNPDSVFMECGHGGVCYECALEVWKATGECFLCRNKITQVLQIDLNYKNDNIIKVLSSTQMVVEELN